MDPTNKRKLDHVRTVQAHPDTDRNMRHFDQIRLRHRALPEIDLAEVNPGIHLLGRQLDFPLLISSMTGGDDPLLTRINRNLAEAAQACRVAMAVGSQRVMFSQTAARESFALRQYAPDTLLLANLGAVQLNNGFSVQQCREAVEAVGADALCLHLNPLQEAVQDGGNTNFHALADRIGAITRELKVPVIVKEVGAGLSEPDIELLLHAGVRTIDAAGTGGTSWSSVEHYRQGAADSLGLCFQDWGLPTPLVLKSLRPYADHITIIASGGIRTGIDMAKAVILGASLCGVASPFLDPAAESAEAVINLIQRMRRQFVTAMFLLGVPRVDALQNNLKLIHSSEN